jgi:hypothetical protein
LKQKSGATEIRSGNSSAIVVEIIQNLPRIVADSAATMKAYIQNCRFSCSNESLFTKLNKSLKDTSADILATGKQILTRQTWFQANFALLAL